MKRFLVYEIEGWPIDPSNVSRRQGTSRGPGLTVWVSDEAYNGKEIRVWHSETTQKGVYWTREKRMRAEAHELANRLNEEHETRLVAC